MKTIMLGTLLLAIVGCGGGSNEIAKAGGTTQAPRK